MKNITLHIDTRNNKLTKVSLLENEKITSNIKSSKVKAENVFFLIEKMLFKNNLTIFEINKIYVEQGPGSFTGLKVGTAIANALSFCLQKPVNNKKLGIIVEPIYEM